MTPRTALATTSSHVTQTCGVCTRTVTLTAPSPLWPAEERAEAIALGMAMHAVYGCLPLHATRRAQYAEVHGGRAIA